MQRLARARTLVLTLFPLVLLTGCDETDAAAVRLKLGSDLSGTLTTSALEVPAAGGAVGERTQGIQWNSRVSMVCNAGSFAKLADVKLFDVTLAGQVNADGLSYLHITLPRGENAAWARALVPLNAEERARSAQAFDPSGKSDQVGATVKFEVSLPSNVIGNGLQGRTRGVKVSAENEVATLVVPLETALTAGESLVWHVTWEQ